ncbi:MAG: GntR family transcriptional regulator [Lachnospiraceae bacterium]|nr:GntR family transcriptional regulator [Lachnospiraceae bacterium]
MGRTPAYKTVYFAIKRGIQEGVYKKGTLLPSEPELEKQFSVSRTTIRKAISLLTAEGYLDVKQGRGTIVLDTSTTQWLNSITSITETLVRRGYEVTTQGVCIDLVYASETVAAALEVPVGTQVYQIQRVQCADGMPIAIINNYLRTNNLPDLQSKAESFTSLYHMLETEYNVILLNATENITAISADFTEAQILRVPIGTPLLLVKRISCTEHGPIEYAFIKIVASKYEYSVHLEGRGPAGIS